MSEPTARKSDLGTRAVSAVVMLVVAGTALWLGGWWWTALVGLITAGVLFEWRRLVQAFASAPGLRAVWMLAGILYLGVAAATLMFLRDWQGVAGVLVVLLMVIGTDVGAYFTGRAVGGPKIAPKISPSKTWSGLLGGIAGAGFAMIAMTFALHQFYATSICQWYYDRLDSFDPEFPPGTLAFDDRCHFTTVSIDLTFVWQSILVGAVVAVVAQAGDFFESWMKRRAGVKDSSQLIPGHGGLFDRVDGLLGVSFVTGIVFLLERVIGGG